MPTRPPWRAAALDDDAGEPTAIAGLLVGWSCEAQQFSAEPLAKHERDDGCKPEGRGPQRDVAGQPLFHRLQLDLVRQAVDGSEIIGSSPGRLGQVGLQLIIADGAAAL